jgi:hypothetical protein
MSAASSASPPAKPLALEHLAKARRNYKVYLDLKQKGEHLDWAVVVLFYTALHLVQAYLVENAKTKFDIPEDHRARDPCIWRKLRPIYNQYNTLLSRSKTARYDPSSAVTTPQELQECELQQFARIAAELSALGVKLEP